MNDSFFTYLELLELMIFFSGYSLMYLLVRSVEDNLRNRSYQINISFLLPYAYALTGTLYLALQLKILYPDYGFEHIRSVTQTPLLKLFGLLSLLFYIPFLAKKPLLSLLHSLVFFFFIVKDLWLFINKTTDAGQLKNDMNIYTYSILINIAAFCLINGIYIIYRRLKTQNKK